MGPHSVPVTLVKRTKGEPDDFGNDTWAEASTVVRGVVSPGSSIESVQGQDTLTDQPTVYLDPGTDLTHLDAVVIAGLQYEVDGLPTVWRHPLTGWTPGIEVRLRRST